MEKMFTDVLRETGYINLLQSQANSKYIAQSFNTGRELMAGGFLAALERELLQLLYREYAVNDSLTILDAGTGDGLLFSNILLCMRWDQYRHRGIGIDHCMPLVQMAARDHPQALWLVADINEIPVTTASVDVVLNSFAPANFEEFLRILKPGGLILKTIAGPEHLQEMPGLLQVQDHGDEYAEDLIRQYTGGLEKLRIKFKKQLRETAITIDLIILCGRKAY